MHTSDWVALVALGAVAVGVWAFSRSAPPTGSVPSIDASPRMAPPSLTRPSHPSAPARSAAGASDASEALSEARTHLAALRQTQHHLQRQMSGLMVETQSLERDVAALEREAHRIREGYS